MIGGHEKLIDILLVQVQAVEDVLKLCHLTYHWTIGGLSLPSNLGTVIHSAGRRGATDFMYHANHPNEGHDEVSTSFDGMRLENNMEDIEPIPLNDFSTTIEPNDLNELLTPLLEPF